MRSLLLFLGMLLGLGPGGGAAPARPQPPLWLGRAVRRWCVNDTLVLEFSRPLTWFVTLDDPVARPALPALAQARAQLWQWQRRHGRWGSFTVLDSASGWLPPGPTHPRDTLWQRVTARGRRGYRQVLATGSACLLHPRWSARAREGNVLSLAQLSPATAQLDSLRQLRGRPLLLDAASFVAEPWDVRYRTWGRYLDANLQELPARYPGLGFATGPLQGRSYYLLPHWLAQEQARLARTHRPPAPARLGAWLALSQDTAPGGRLPPPYRPLLARLLRAYQRGALPPGARQQVSRALAQLGMAK